MSVNTISKNFTGEVKSLIVRAVYEALNDPDLGLELSEKAKQRLRKARYSKSKGVSFAEIKKRYL